MDSQDPSGAVSSVIKVLRKATRIVQLAPFAYLVFFVVYMLFGWAVQDETLCMIDKVAGVSPLATGGLLIGSKLFKLCGWHKVACLLPFSSQVEGFVDSYIVTFTQNEVIFINTAIGMLSLLFIILAIRHFSHGRK